MALEVNVRGSSIVGSIEIHAPPATVFEALIDPEHLRRWWGSPDTYWVESWVSDFRVGGLFRCECQSKEHNRSHAEGKFIEIDAPKLLVYTWNPSWIDVPETTIRWLLEPRDYGVLVIVTHEGFAGHPAALDAHRQGWPSILTWLSEYCSVNQKQ